VFFSVSLKSISTFLLLISAICSKHSPSFIPAIERPIVDGPWEPSMFYAKLILFIPLDAQLQAALLRLLLWLPRRLFFIYTQSMRLFLSLNPIKVFSSLILFFRSISYSNVLACCLFPRHYWQNLRYISEDNCFLLSKHRALSASREKWVCREATVLIVGCLNYSAYSRGFLLFDKLGQKVSTSFEHFYWNVPWWIIDAQ